MLSHAALSFDWAATERSSVTFGDSLDFILFANSKGVRSGALRCIDDFISEALGNRLHVSESRFTSSLADQVNSLVDSAEWGHIDSLSTNNTT